MIKIDLISGFLGAGKTTLIKKLLKEALAGEKVVLIENEFGEIGVDGGFLKEAGIEIKEMNSGCICCSLVGDFAASLKEVLDTYEPDRVLIEPSGVGKLSDVIKAVKDMHSDKEVVVNSAVAVVDASKCKMYIKNFGEFYINQIEHAGTIILSRTANMSQDKLEKCLELMREHNENATIITTPWDELSGEKILETIQKEHKMEEILLEEVEHEHHHHEHGEECGCGHDHEHHHHENGEECGCGHDHEHHHHEHGEECGCGHDHEHHHHENGEECGCGHDHEHHHHEHGHHHADEVFTSWGMETAASYSEEEMEEILEKLEDEASYGMVLRAKGMVKSTAGTWIYFDYVPGEKDIREGQAEVTGKFCVIGSKLQEENLKELFKK